MEEALDKVKILCLKEKGPLTTDVSAMDKSVSDLLKEFEKQKEVIKGHPMSEESLEQCVENYLRRI